MPKTSKKLVLLIPQKNHLCADFFARDFIQITEQDCLGDLLADDLNKITVLVVIISRPHKIPQMLFSLKKLTEVFAIISFQSGDFSVMANIEQSFVGATEGGELKGMHPLPFGEVVPEMKAAPSRENLSMREDFTHGYGAEVFNYLFSDKLSNDQIKEVLSEQCSCLFRQRIKSVSVVIPVFNRSELFLAAYHSVLSQTFSPKELIIVDDGSTDSKTTKTLADIQKEKPNFVQIIRIPVNRGVSFARNLGAQAATGEFLCFLDSDDTWEKDKLKAQLCYMEEHPFLRITQCHERWLRGDKVIKQKKAHRKKSGIIWSDCLKICFTGPSCVLMEKSLFDQMLGFDESLPSCEDYDLWLKISRKYLFGLSLDVSVTKNGGHQDQLSCKYPLIDRFRVYSALRAMASEKNDFHRRALRDNALGRLDIMAAGAKKRGQDASLFEYLKEHLSNPEEKSLLDLLSVF